MAKNPLKTDPTRTTTLRGRFISSMNRRFREVKTEIKNLIVALDVFGIKDRTPLKFNGIINNVEARAWEFATDDVKVQRFRDWLSGQVDRGILQVDNLGQPWTNEFVGSAYRTGVTRSFIDSNAGAIAAGEDGFFTGGKEQFLKSAFDAPETVSKLKLISTRTFENLKGVTVQMSNDMARILADGLASGLAPEVISKTMAEQVDKLTRTRARAIARTEIIHAHAEGQLDSFERLGVEEVGVLVEWLTSSDDRVCERCAEMEGVVLKVKEARGMIPRHTNCLLPDNKIQGNVIAALKAFYDGEALEILTRNGCVFTVTPNHTIPTEKGLVLSGKLNAGDKLISYTGKTKFFSRHKYKAPAFIEDVFNSFSASRTQIPARTFDLNGDEKFFTSKVDVVLSNSGFLKRISQKGKRIYDVIFVNTCYSFMRSTYLLLSFFSRHLFPLDFFGLALCSECDSICYKIPVNTTPTHTKFFRKCINRNPLRVLFNKFFGVKGDTPTHTSFGLGSQLDVFLNKSSPKGLTFDPHFFSKLRERFPCEITLDEIIHIKSFHYVGPVYNVETIHGYFTTTKTGLSSVLIGNCRCAFSPAFEGDGKHVSKKEIDDAIQASIKAERPNKSFKKTKKKSKWIGKRKTIGTSRQPT